MSYQYAVIPPRVLAAVVVAGSMAFGLTIPTGTAHAQEVILTIDGSVTDGPKEFDIAALQAMRSVTFATSTNWTEGVPSFTGVPLKALLESVGATGTEINAIALNNYSVPIPMDSLTDEAPIVAYHIDGKTFSRRDKGPLWIVYPFDSSEDYRNELIYGRSIWQLQKLTVQ